MDNPLIPKQSGPKRLAMQVVGFLFAVFLVVVVICTFLTGFKADHHGWLITAASLILLLATSGVLVRWVINEELEEAKYTYLIASQCFSMMVLCVGIMAIIYAPVPPAEYVIAGCASAIPQAGLTLKIDDGGAGQVASVAPGDCNGFSFPKRVKEGTKITASVDRQPSSNTSVCTGGSRSTASGDMVGSKGFSFQCFDAVQLGGTVTLNEGLDGGVVLRNAQDSYTANSIGARQYKFDTPLRIDGEGSSYSVSAVTPEGAECSFLTSPEGKITEENKRTVKVDVVCSLKP